MIGRRAFIAAGVIWASPLRADEPDPLATITKAREKMKSVAGPFTQTRTIGLLKTAVASRGTMMLVRPDRLRWELAPPDEVTYWVTPDGLAYRGRNSSARVSSSQSARLSAGLGDLRALFIDMTPLRARYDLDVRLREDGATLDATARDPAKAAFKKVTLELARDLIRPTRAVLIEGPRDRTEIVFGELVVNGPIDPKLLVPP
jgi:outer membrane lipoprotein-sorting protein